MVNMLRAIKLCLIKKINNFWKKKNIVCTYIEYEQLKRKEVI